MSLFDWENKISMDKCALLAKERENMSMLEYHTFNYFGNCTERLNKINEFSTKYPNLRFKDGYGVANCLIDNDTQMRFDNTRLTHGPEKRQYHVRNFQAVPYFGRGSCAPNTESLLKNGEDTSKLKHCNILTETDFNRYVPFIDCIKNYVTLESQVIPEMQTIGVISKDLLKKPCKV